MTKSIEIQNGPTQSGGLKRRMRSLRAGEKVPDSTPRRYCYDRYVNLRWKIGKGEYVEVREHRVRNGVVVNGIVHHINEKKSDNSPTNLKICKTHSEHRMEHRKIDRAKAVSLYKSGVLTTELSKILKCDPASLSRILRAEGLEMKHGAGKSPSNRIVVDEQFIADALKRNRWNVLWTERETGFTRQLIRRVQLEWGLPRIKGNLIRQTPNTCSNCNRLLILRAKGRCNACYLWWLRSGVERPKNKSMRTWNTGSRKKPVN